MDDHKRRIDEHDFLLHKFQKRTDMEYEYEARITKVEGKLATTLNKLSNEMDGVYHKLAVAEASAANNQNTMELL